MSAKNTIGQVREDCPMVKNASRPKIVDDDVLFDGRVAHESHKNVES
jgi:hypothetical protein